MHEIRLPVRFCSYRADRGCELGVLGDLISGTWQPCRKPLIHRVWVDDPIHDYHGHEYYRGHDIMPKLSQAKKWYEDQIAMC